MRTKLLATHLAPSLLVACFGGPVPLGAGGGDDGGTIQAADFATAPACSGNNDGVIARDELVFPLGFTVNYLVNPPGTTQTVAPAGTQGPGGTTWDLADTEGKVQPFTLQPVAGQWFAASFPGASYAILSDIGSGTLGVYRVTDDAVLLLGFASSKPNDTLLVYDAPVTTLRFPLRPGDGFVTGGRIVGGKLGGVPFASSDTYRVSVDERGTATLPYLTFANTLRVHVDVSQALPGGVTVTRTQYLFYHECYGELGRMVSRPGETNPAFTTAAEFRRLAL